MLELDTGLEWLTTEKIEKLIECLKEKEDETFTFALSVVYNLIETESIEDFLYKVLDENVMGLLNRQLNEVQLRLFLQIIYHYKDNENYLDATFNESCLARWFLEIVNLRIAAITQESAALLISTIVDFCQKSNNLVETIIRGIDWDNIIMQLSIAGPYYFNSLASFITELVYIDEAAHFVLN